VTTVPLTPAPATTPGPRRRPSALGVELVFIGRGLRHTVRNADALITALALPVMIMLLFVYVFGTAVETGGDYVDFVAPGIIVLCAGLGAASTAIGVAQDRHDGVIDRFRTMPVRSSAVLTGHVVASLARNLVSTGLVVFVGLLVGFRPDAAPVEWLAVVGLVILFVLALTWLAAAIGLVVRSVEAASAFSFFVMFVPYLSSAFVPTDGMGGAMRTFADHQPVTPVVDTLRGLLTGSAVGTDGWWAVGWCLAVLVPSVAWASSLFRRQGLS
jgi:ABC-2 type transport system permease protein